MRSLGLSAFWSIFSTLFSRATLMSLSALRPRSVKNKNGFSSRRLPMPYMAAATCLHIIAQSGQLQLKLIALGLGKRPSFSDAFHEKVHFLFAVSLFLFYSFLNALFFTFSFAFVKYVFKFCHHVCHISYLKVEGLFCKINQFYGIKQPLECFVFEGVLGILIE